jgi:putative transposase
LSTPIKAANSPLKSSWTWFSSGVKLSMDGRAAWRDNVFVELIWRTVKYERVYLRAYETVSEAKEDMAQYIDWCNTARPHSSLGGQTPERFLIGGMTTFGLVA